MAISETNKIKNNRDLTQHFLYTYSNAFKVGPRETTRIEFNEDLIFDRSRKSIFTQSQEFGYISDTVYTLSVGNELNNGETRITLRSYEGNIEFYKFNPLVITGVKWNNTDKVHIKYEKFNPEYFYITYIGSGKISYLNIKLNNNSIYSSNNINNAAGEITVNVDKDCDLICGKNTINVFAYSQFMAYNNTSYEDQHNSKSGNNYFRFQPENQITYYSYNIDFYAYNPIDIIETSATYWDITHDTNKLKITDRTDRRLTDDYYQEFHDDHYICKNKQNKTLSLFIPSRLENNPKIYGFVGGSSTEFYKMKSITYCGEQYNFYTGTGNNWNGLDLWFQKKS